MRPRCCLRYLTFFGINMDYSLPRFRLGSGPRAVRRVFRLRLLLPARRGRSGHRRQNRSRCAASPGVALHRLRRFGSRSDGPRPTIAIPVAIAIPPLRTRCAPRLGLIAQSFALTTRQNLALINPALHADHAVSGVGFTESVIDIGAQRVQRKLPLQIPFRPRDFSAVQAPRHANFNSLAAETQRRIDRFAHRAAERHALFELQRDRFRHQLRVELGLVHFLNVDENFALGLLRQIALQLLDLRALASDDDAGTRRRES